MECIYQHYNQASYIPLYLFQRKVNAGRISFAIAKTALAFEAINPRIFLVSDFTPSQPSRKILLHVSFVQLYEAFPLLLIEIRRRFSSAPIPTIIGSSRTSSMYTTTLTLSEQVFTTSVISSRTS